MANLALKTLLALALATSGSVAHATVVYDAISSADPGYGTDVLSEATYADRFFNKSAGTLDSVSLQLRVNGNPITDDFLVRLWNDSGSGPDENSFYEVGTIKDKSLTTSFQVVTLGDLGKYDFALAANTYYWIGIDAIASETTALIARTLDPNVLARPGVVAGGVYADGDFSNGALSIYLNSTGPYQIAVSVTPDKVAEPATLPLAMGGMGLLGFAVRRRARN